MSADEIRRLLFRISEINSQCQRVMYDVSGDFDYWAILHNVGESSTSTNRLAVGATLKEKEKNSRRRDRSAKRLQQSLIWVQELADEKKQIVTQLQELIEIKTRQVALETASASIGTGSGSGNGGGGGGASSSGSGNNYSAETKKRKADPISEDGLTYCVCNQASGIVRIVVEIARI
ncbi:uncharacterized protein LOC142237597 [Haematobia irritans]|uniref:uncharacterized protein LOC142237597 n=1 Tax=Haematobia irritans TaxID=7368 RepID=UPI003F50881C